MTEQTPEPQVPQISQNLITTNLDTAQRDNVRPRFWFIVGGREIVLADPGDLDWQVINAMDNEVEYLKQAMSVEDLGFFLQQSIPVWKMEKLGRDYQKHYGAEEPGKAGHSGS